MKVNRTICALIVIIVCVQGSNFIEAMLQERPSDKTIKTVPSQKIITKGKVLTIAAIATLLALSAAYVHRIVNQYAKEYGMPAVIVALRYNLPFQPAYLKIVAAASQHDDARLQAGLAALNNALLGQDWRQTRVPLIEDFITMDQIAFSQKYPVMRMHILHLLKTYAAAWDLYDKKASIRTYTRGIPSLKNQAKYMHELNEKVGLI